MLKPGNYIGIMSGTSLDGVDVVLAKISDSTVKQLAYYYCPMPDELRNAVLSICQGQTTTLRQIGEIDLKLGRLYAQAVLSLLQENNLTRETILAIGCHGQTVWHQPNGEYRFSIQLGDNNQIAALTGITTIGDFRRRDMAWGGQGAPLVPAFHHALLADKNERRIVLNIGGIANLSLLFPNQPISGFDSGPGNILLDAWIVKNRRQHYDKGGQWAATGQVNRNLLAVMLTDPYFIQLSPKSTGREYFNLAWLEKILTQYPVVKTEDVQATLVELTAITICEQINLAGGCNTLLVCGGGANNSVLMARLGALLSNTHVVSTDEYGVSSDNMEALAFAWLAARTFSGLSGNLPSVTGAQKETILGAIYPVEKPII